MCPRVLLSDPENTLLPKIEFFRSKGTSSSDLTTILSSNPHLWKRSLNKYIIPSYDFLKTVLLVDQKVLKALQRSAGADIANNMANVSLLRELGVPHYVISSFLMNNPRTAFSKHTKLLRL
ncbi:transcription termination factor mterf15, mitochondrial [Fagus crenata]